MSTDTAGAAMFARYAYPPNELGYCGPDEPESLLAATDASGSVTDLVSLARQFDGAWCYLQTIAAGTGHTDPLDREVVEAYWLGGALVERLDDRVFARAVTTRFGDQHGARMAGLATDQRSTGPARAHHAFHVFEVYPWTGLLEVNHGQPALSVLDRCRIRWGRVLEVDGDHALVRSRPLTWDGQDLALGQARTEHPRWAHRGRSLLGQVHAGEQVALHWDWICDTLSPDQLQLLRRRTVQQLELTNRARHSAGERERTHL